MGRVRVSGPGELRRFDRPELLFIFYLVSYGMRSIRILAGGHRFKI